jgi:hypothetical protein
MGPEVHLRRTHAWALDEGFTPAEAEMIARFDLGYDSRYPARRSVKNITRHFAPMAWLWSRYYLRRAVATNDLMMLGYALHTAQDAVSHGTLGERHLLQHARLGRHPDVWDIAPSGIKRRIERVSRTRLRRFLAARGFAGR